MVTASPWTWTILLTSKMFQITKVKSCFYFPLHEKTKLSYCPFIACYKVIVSYLYLSSSEKGFIQSHSCPNRLFVCKLNISKPKNEGGRKKLLSTRNF